MTEPVYKYVTTIPMSAELWADVLERQRAWADFLEGKGERITPEQWEAERPERVKANIRRNVSGRPAASFRRSA